MLIKTPIDGILRSAESNALINTNNDALLSYKAQKKKIKDELIFKQKVEQQINSLEKDITEIKDMLSQLLNRKEG
jgi:septal ring factor EnvC (AmiA/AmiB activator)